MSTPSSNTHEAVKPSKKNRRGKYETQLFVDPTNHDPQEMLQLQADKYMAMMREIEGKDHLCTGCWLMNRYCFCHRIDKAPIRHNVLVYMHYKEIAQARASNSGKLLLQCIGAKRYICGSNEEEADLIAEISKNPHRTLILYPGPDSMYVTEFLEAVEAIDGPGETATPSSSPSPSSSSLPVSEVEKETKESGGDVDESDPIPTPSRHPLTIVVLDGTWKNARMMCRRVRRLLGEIKVSAVKLKDSTRADFQPLRNHTAVERVSTTGAVIHLLRELGDSPEAVQSLSLSLVASIEHYAKQTKKPLPAADGRSARLITEDTRVGMFSKEEKRKFAEEQTEERLKKMKEEEEAEEDS